jgi:hypothetical protein
MSNTSSPSTDRAWLTAVTVGGSLVVAAAVLLANRYLNPGPAEEANLHRHKDLKDADGQTIASTSSGSATNSVGGTTRGGVSRSATPDRESSVLRSVTPTMAYRLGADLSDTSHGGKHAPSPGRPSAPLDSHRRPSGRSAPTSVDGGEAAEGASVTASTTSGSLQQDAEDSSESFYARLRSQLEWCDPVLGLYLQYHTEDVVMTAEERMAPSVTLRFDPRRALYNDSGVGITDVGLIAEQVGPLLEDRAGLGDPGCVASPAASFRHAGQTESNVTTTPGRPGALPAPLLPPAVTAHEAEDIQASLGVASPQAPRNATLFGDERPKGSKSKTAAASSAAAAATAAANAQASLPARVTSAVSLQEYALRNIEALDGTERLTVTSSRGTTTPMPTLTIKPTKQRTLALLDGPTASSIIYAVITYRVNPPLPARQDAAPTYGAVFVAAHPYVANLFVLLRVTANKKAIKATDVPKAIQRLLSCISYAPTIPTPSYLVLSEPRHGLGVRLPLCFGRHRHAPSSVAFGGEETETLSGSESDDDINFDRLLTKSKVGRHLFGGSRASQAGEAAAGGRRSSRHTATARAPSDRGSAGTAEVGPARPGAAAGTTAARTTRPLLQSNTSARGTTVAFASNIAAPNDPSNSRIPRPIARSQQPRGASVTRYALLCCDDCAIFATFEPFVPGGAAALPVVTRRCVDRMVAALYLSPRLVCQFDTDAPQMVNKRGDPAPPHVLRARNRALNISRLGDASWWSEQLRTQLSALGITPDNVNLVNNPSDPRAPDGAAVEAPPPPDIPRGSSNPTVTVHFASAGTMETLSIPPGTASPTSSPMSGDLAATLPRFTVGGGAAAGVSGGAGPPGAMLATAADNVNPENCRFAVYCAAIPMPTNPHVASSYVSFTFIARRSVSRIEFAKLYRRLLDHITLHNHRGQGPTLHYVGRRHGIRLQIPREWHVLEPAIADPALLIYRCASPNQVPPFLTSQVTDDALAALSGVMQPLDPIEGWDIVNAAAPFATSMSASVMLKEIAGHPLRTPAAVAAAANALGLGYPATPVPVNYAAGVAPLPAGVSPPQPPAPPAATTTAAEMAAHPHHGPEWWRHLLPVISLRTMAAPSKLELMRMHEAVVRTTDAIAPSPTYYELWSRWAVAMARGAAECTGGVGSDPSQPTAASPLRARLPVNFASAEDIDVAFEHVKLGGMRGVLIRVASPVVIETTVRNHHRASPSPPSPTGTGQPPLSRLSSVSSMRFQSCQGTFQGANSASQQHFTTQATGPVLSGAPLGPQPSASLHASPNELLGADSAASLQGGLDGGNSEPVLRLYRSAMPISANTPPPGYNPFGPPHLEALTECAPNLAVALAAHAQAWRWAASSGGFPDVAADWTTRRSQASSNPPTPVQRPVSHGGGARGAKAGGGGSGGSASAYQAATTSSYRIGQEVRFIVALLPPLWHQEAHSTGAETMGVGGARNHGNVDDADDSPANYRADRSTLVWQAQAVPAPLAQATRAALVAMLRTLELIGPS